MKFRLLLMLFTLSMIAFSCSMSDDSFSEDEKTEIAPKIDHDIASANALAEMQSPVTYQDLTNALNSFYGTNSSYDFRLLTRLKWKYKERGGSNFGTITYTGTEFIIEYEVIGI